MRTYRVFVNAKEVNSFDTPDAAYDFALAIEMGQLPLEDYNGSKNVSFEDDNGVTNTETYSIKE